MKQKNVGIIILSVLFILSLTCFIIGIINHNKDNDTDINNKNVSLDVNEKNNTNDTIDTNNTNDTNIDIENNTTEEFDNNEEYEDGIVYDEIIKEDTSNYNNKALICVKKYYKSYKTTEEGFDDYEYLLANDKTTSKQFYYSYYPITNKSGCGDTIKEIKIKGSIDNFKLFINNSNDDSGYADITEPIDNEFLAYFDDNTIKIYDMINEESYTTKASFKDYYIRNIVVKNNKPIKLILESDSINSIGMNTYNIHEISKSNYNYNVNNSSRKKKEVNESIIYLSCYCYFICNISTIV